MQNIKTFGILYIGDHEVLKQRKLKNTKVFFISGKYRPHFFQEITKVASTFNTDNSKKNNIGIISAKKTELSTHSHLLHSTERFINHYNRYKPHKITKQDTLIIV